VFRLCSSVTHLAAVQPRGVLSRGRLCGSRGRRRFLGRWGSGAVAVRRAHSQAVLLSVSRHTPRPTPTHLEGEQRRHDEHFSQQAAADSRAGEDGRVGVEAAPVSTGQAGEGSTHGEGPRRPAQRLQRQETAPAAEERGASGPAGFAPQQAATQTVSERHQRYEQGDGDESRQAAVADSRICEQ